MEKRQTLRLHSRMFLFYKLIMETYVSLFLFLFLSLNFLLSRNEKLYEKNSTYKI